MLQQVGLVAVGGAIGAALRYLVGEWLSGDGFPYATLSVNLIGSLMLGALAVGAAQHLVSHNLVLVFATGLLGAFTTMSAFSVETVALFDKGETSIALTYISLTMTLCPLVALLGWKLSEAYWI
jgi:CrcB protein